MAPNTLATQVGVNETNNFSVAVKVDARNLYAVQYKLTYDPSFLSLQSVVDGSFKGSPGACMTTATPGVVAVYCTRYSPELEVNNPAGETISTITFKADRRRAHPQRPLDDLSGSIH